MAKSNEKKRDFFWLSYSDLMTSLFFVMLVLFVLVYTMQNKLIGELGEKGRELDRIKEIEKTINNIDTTYFKYDEVNKKHILNMQFLYPVGSADISEIVPDKRNELLKAGQTIKNLILNYCEKNNLIPANIWMWAFDKDNTKICITEYIKNEIQTELNNRYA